MQTCQNLKLELLWLRRIKLNLIFFYKILTKRYDSDSITIPYLANEKYNLRNRQHQVGRNSCSTVKRQNFFLTKYRSLWNRLPESIRLSPTLASFKKSLEIFLGESGAQLILGDEQTLSDAYNIGPIGI